MSNTRMGDSRDGLACLQSSDLCAVIAREHPDVETQAGGIPLAAKDITAEASLPFAYQIIVREYRLKSRLLVSK